MNVYFEKNQGQSKYEIKYYIKINQYTVLFLNEQIIIHDIHNKSPINNDIVLNFENSNKDTIVSGEDKLSFPKISYINNNDEMKWIKNVDIFSRLKYKEIYPNIDMMYYEKEDKLKYDFIINKDGSYTDIKISLDSKYNINKDDNGNLNIEFENNKITLHKPYSYQMIKEKEIKVKSEFIVKNNCITFDVHNYAENYPLIIDPFIEYSTYLGGTQNEYPTKMTIDKNNNVYITGETESADFEKNPDKNSIPLCIFVMKIDKLGKVVWVIYIGADYSDEIKAIEVDSQDNIYISGYSMNSIYPIKNQMKDTLPNKYDKSKYKIFISKLKVNNNSVDLVFSSLLGGSDFDFGLNMKIDNEGNIYIVGQTNSIDFPVKNQLNIPVLESTNGFISKIVLREEDGIDGDVGYLTFSSIIGGSGIDYTRSIDFDNLGTMYIMGKTLSTDFPTINQIQNQNELGDIFLIKIKLTIENKFSEKGEILASTRLGNNSLDTPISIKIDKDESIYIGGHTTASDYPIKNELYSYYETNNAINHLFLTKIKSNEVVFSTYCGGNFFDTMSSMDIDYNGSVYIAGITYSTNFPLVKQYMDFPGDNQGNGYISRIYIGEDNIASLTFSTYLGGKLYDSIDSIKLDEYKNIYVSGITYSLDFPVKNELHGYRDKSDAFVTKVNPKTIIFEKNLFIKVKKNKISYDEALLLSCYINLPTIEDSYLNQEIKQISFDLDGVCPNEKIRAYAYYKEVFAKLVISYDVVLYSGNECSKDFKIYGIEDTYSTCNVEYGCFNIDEIINITIDDFTINATFDVLEPNTFNDYYGFNIHVEAFLN